MAGFLWKDKSDDGVRSILEKGLIPLDRLLVETDAPFMYPNVRGSKIPANIKQALSERYVWSSLLNWALRPRRHATYNYNFPFFLFS